MSEAVAWDIVTSPEEIFARGAPFIGTFGESIEVQMVNPMDRPLDFAEAAARLNPRHPQSVFRSPQATTTAYLDRYAMADNGLPAWAAPHEGVINDVAHNLGIRDKEIGATFHHDFAPGGHYQLGLALEGANSASKNRGGAMADAVRRGEIVIDRMVVAGTDRTVGAKEGHGNIGVGYGVAAKTVAALHQDYPDVFGRGGVPLDTLLVRTRSANTREVVGEAALRLNIGSVVMSGSNIYGSWMRTDLATVQHSLNLDKVGFGAGPDDPKAARTPLIWAAEVSQTLVSAAYLRHAHMTKRGY